MKRLGKKALCKIRRNRARRPVRIHVRVDWKPVQRALDGVRWRMEAVSRELARAAEAATAALKPLPAAEINLDAWLEEFEGTLKLKGFLRVD